MSITDALILAPDVEWVAVEVLQPEIQRRLTWELGDYALTRPRSRTLPKLINAQAVALVEEFHSETTIVEAILRYCEKYKSDPKTTLYEAFPMLQQLISVRLLIPPEEVKQVTPTYEPGDWVVGAKVLHCIQSMEDTEVYCVLWNGRKTALKIACSINYKVMLLREIEILKQLDGQLAPAFIAAGTEERGYPYVLTEWLEGVPIHEAAEQLRSLNRSKILKLCVVLLRTYEQLHKQKLLHGDVHPRNIFVCGEEVKLIDFGLCRQDGDLTSSVGGVHFYFAPEQAEHLSTKQRLPPSTILSEQYALAALIYQLIVSNYHIDFTIKQSELLRQIVEDKSLPFSYWEHAPWPEVEIPLQKALSKVPEDRFKSVGAFANELERSLAPETPLILLQTTSIQTQLKAFLELTSVDGTLLNTPWPQTTSLSVFDGASGVAYALYRIACLRSDPALLATADLWATRAHQHRSITTEQTAYFSLGELHCVRAMIAHAYGNETLLNEAICDFLNTDTFSPSSFALLPGIAGSLHVCTLLLETVQTRQDLLEKGTSYLETLWRDPASTFSTHYLGMAHGWAGILHTTFRWCRVAQIPLPNEMQRYLGELAALSQRFGSGQRWPWRRDKKGYLPGWCHGNAGFYYLWIQASLYQIDHGSIAFAEGSAWQCLESPSYVTSLCCGLVGQIYALLHFYQYTGEHQWKERALKLTQKLAIHKKHQRNSLYQGNVGTALLAAELDYPEFASMPFFGADPNL